MGALFQNLRRGAVKGEELAVYQELADRIEGQRTALEELVRLDRQWIPTAEGGSLRSDKAVVSFRNNVIAHATITGTPAQFEQLRTDGSTSRGRANTIDYETANGTVSLRHRSGDDLGAVPLDRVLADLARETSSRDASLTVGRS